MQATDQDAGEDGKVYYLFVGSSNDRGFSINTNTGVISVSRNLDRETQSRIVLTVMAKNAGGIRGNDTDEAQVIVTVQDGNDPPEFLQVNTHIHNPVALPYFRAFRQHSDVNFARHFRPAMLQIQCITSL